MIPITRQEADAIRTKYPDAHITKTMKNHSKSKRGKRYIAVYKGVLMLLSELRGVEVTDN